MRQILLFLFIFSIAHISTAQEKDYFRIAEKAFQSSEYKKAAEYFRAAYIMTGVETTDKQKLCNICAEAQKKAREQKKLGNITDAEIWYKRILENNPNDLEAGAFLNKKTFIVELAPGKRVEIQNINASQAKVPYQTAEKYTVASRYNGHNDWRLPYVSELEVIIPNIPNEMQHFELFHAKKNQIDPQIMITYRKSSATTISVSINGKNYSEKTYVPDNIKDTERYYIVDRFLNRETTYEKKTYESGKRVEYGDKDFLANFILIRDIK